MPPQSGHGIHCGQLILWKISKIGATRCQILRLKCNKFAGGAYSTPPDPLAVFKGPTSKGREGKGGEEGKVTERGGEERVGPQLGSLDPPVKAQKTVLPIHTDVNI